MCLVVTQQATHPPFSAFVVSQTSNLNKYLQSLMDGLTAKVFRTYNASITLQNQLKELTDRMCLSVFYIVTDLSLLLISCDDKV